MIRNLVLACALLGGLTGSAFAQSSAPRSATIVDPRQTARMRFGRFLVTPSLTIDRIGLDQNVVDADGARSSDFVVSMVPQVVIWLPFSNRALITTSLKNGVSYYKNHPQQSSLDPGISVKGELKLGRLLPFAERAFDQARRRPNDEVDVRVPLTSVSTSAGFAYQPQAKSSFELSAYRTKYTYGTDARYLGFNLSNELNRNQQGVRLRIDHRLTSLTAVHFAIENRQEKFKIRSGKDAAGIRTVIGAEMGRKALLFGEAEIGYQSLESAMDPPRSYNRMVAFAALTRQFQSSTSVTVRWARDVNASFQTEYPFHLSNTTLLQLRQQLFRSFDGIFELDRSNVTYIGTGNQLSQHVVTKGAGVDIGCRLGRGARLGLAVSRTWRSSEIAALRGFSGVRAGLSFSMGF